MKGFSTYAVEQVTLTRGEESHTFEMRPLPFGFTDFITEVMPPPKAAINAEKPDDRAMSVWASRRLFVWLGKALGSQIDAVAPGAKSSAREWEAYADAVKGELVAANFVEGDVQILLDVLTKLNKGAGNLPKA